MRLPIRPINVLVTLFSVFLLNGTTLAKPNAEALYDSGLNHYESEQYNEAIEQLEQAVELEPENATYHHLLAVSYGKEAERTNWLRAMDLAEKTLEHLEIASKLDRHNIEILDDLMDYYRAAPGFLGGDSKKADETEQLIEKLRAKEAKSTKID